MKYHTTIYWFDELDLGDGLLVSGQVNVDYRYHEPDPSVNYPGEIKYYLKDITIATPNGNYLQLKDHDDLREDVERALEDQCDDAIEMQVYDELEAEYALREARREDDQAFNCALRHDSSDATF